jgi:hypothetical protein
MVGDYKYRVGFLIWRCGRGIAMGQVEGEER